MPTAIPEEYQPAKSGLTLYSTGTPNGYKIEIALRQLGLDYKLIDVPLLKGAHFAPWFKEHITITSTIPVLFDYPEEDPASTEPKIELSETNAILQYIADKYDSKAHKISFQWATPEYYQCLKWMAFVNSSVEGKMMPGIGNATFIPPENKDPKVAATSNTKTRTHLDCLEAHLQTRQFLVADKFSLADIAGHAWIMCAPALEIDLKKDYPVIYAWLRRVYAQPQVRDVWTQPNMWTQFSCCALRDQLLE